MASVIWDHQQDFIKLLQQKGYAGTFHLQDGLHQWSHTNVLSKCLAFHRDQCQKHVGHIRPFILVNNVRFKNDGDYTECSLNVAYNAEKGFEIKGLDYRIVRIQSHSIGLSNSNSLPDAGVLEKIKNQNDLIVLNNQRVNGNKELTQFSSREQFHIASFADLLEKKGYMSMFDFSAKDDQWQIMDRARACLIFYLLNAKKHHETPGFSMRCFSYYKDDLDFIETYMRMQYDQRSGFHVTSLTLHYPGLQSKTLPLLSSMDLPNNCDLVGLKRYGDKKVNAFKGPNNSTGQTQSR